MARALTRCEFGQVGVGRHRPRRFASEKLDYTGPSNSRRFSGCAVEAAQGSYQPYVAAARYVASQGRWTVPVNLVLWKHWPSGKSHPIRAGRLRDRIPASAMFHRFRGRSRSDPHRLRAEWEWRLRSNCAGCSRRAQRLAGCDIPDFGVAVRLRSRAPATASSSVSNVCWRGPFRAAHKA